MSRVPAPLGRDDEMPESQSEKSGNPENHNARHVILRGTKNLSLSQFFTLLETE